MIVLNLLLHCKHTLEAFTNSYNFAVYCQSCRKTQYCSTDMALINQFIHSIQYNLCYVYIDCSESKHTSFLGI